MKVRDRWRERTGAGSGVWFDLGAHLIDQMLTLFGMPVAEAIRVMELIELGIDSAEQRKTLPVKND